MNEKIKKLKEIIDGTDNLVFFGGAGVSTESGIPDFRSTDGLYSQKYDFPPETIVSHTFFMKRNKDFFDFYKDKMLSLIHICGIAFAFFCLITIIRLLF